MEQTIYGRVAILCLRTNRPPASIAARQMNCRQGRREEGEEEKGSGGNVLYAEVGRDLLETALMRLTTGTACFATHEQTLLKDFFQIL